jgi:hypothetical protein
MSTPVRSQWMRKLRGIACTVGVLASLAYVMATGLSVLAHTFGPGTWGYVGAAGFLAVVGPLPFTLLNLRLFSRHDRLVMAVDASTMVVACVGVARHWHEWLSLPAALAVYLVVRAALWSLPARITRRRALRLLRRQRGTGNEDAWSLRDWEWAYTQLGTPLALQQAAWYRWLQTHNTGGQRPSAT